MNRYFKKVKYFFGFIFNFFCGGQFFSKNCRKPALFYFGFFWDFCNAGGKTQVKFASKFAEIRFETDSEVPFGYHPQNFSNFAGPDLAKGADQRKLVG